MSGVRNFRGILSVILALLLLLCATACNGEREDGNGLKIVVTIFPEYDWVMQILGDRTDRAEVTLLLDNGTDVHSYQPSVSDLVTISECDIFIYVGGNTESWVEDAIKNVSNSEMKVICLTDVLSDRVVEDDHDGAEDHDHDHEKVIDEHIWLSLRNAQICCEYIADQIAACDPENADEYKENAANYATFCPHSTPSTGPPLIARNSTL